MRRWLESTVGLAIAGCLWVSGLAWGLWSLNHYESTPGVAAAAPERWPVDSRIERVPGRATLVMLAHPHCPCTRASIGELALLMARAQGLVSAEVLFGTPRDYSGDWAETDLWEESEAIPGVAAVKDGDGREASLFHAATSGQTLLYDADGKLLFNGGITEARGHSGDNAGRSAILSLLLTGASDQVASEVFGCPLVLSSASDEPEGACHP